MTDAQRHRWKAHYGPSFQGHRPITSSGSWTVLGYHSFQSPTLVWAPAVSHIKT